MHPTHHVSFPRFDSPTPLAARHIPKHRTGVRNADAVRWARWRRCSRLPPSLSPPSQNPAPLGPETGRDVEVDVGCVLTPRIRNCGRVGPRLVSPGGVLLVSPEGAWLVSPEGAWLFSPEGAWLVSPEGAWLVSPEGAWLARNAYPGGRVGWGGCLWLWLWKLRGRRSSLCRW
jgi:hypothetical protein